MNSGGETVWAEERQDPKEVNAAVVFCGIFLFFFPRCETKNQTTQEKDPTESVVLSEGTSTHCLPCRKGRSEPKPLQYQMVTGR